MDKLALCLEIKTINIYFNFTIIIIILKMVENFFRYRINIVLLIFFICINSFEGRINSDSYLISLSFAMIFSAIYVFNKATDIVEDNLNFRSFPIKNITFEQMGD